MAHDVYVCQPVCLVVVMSVHLTVYFHSCNDI